MRFIKSECPTPRVFAPPCLFTLLRSLLTNTQIPLYLSLSTVSSHSLSLSSESPRRHKTLTPRHHRLLVVLRRSTRNPKKPLRTTEMAATEVSDGPVLSLINKRLRALRKKLNRITQMEEAISQGKPINKEQEEVLRSKPGVSALIDELEKLRQPIADAVAEEVSLAVQRHQVSSLSDADGQDKPDEPETGVPEPDRREAEVEDLLNLLYFGSLFDVKPQSDFTSTMLTRTHERGCCLTYDYVTDDATDLLGERDLDLISKLGGLLISRPVDSSLSHKNALQRCLEHAKLWLANSDQLIEPNANSTCKIF